MGGEPAHLLGALFVSAFAQVAESRADIARGARRDFTLYVDEFQNFATDSFTDILSEARKWGLALCLSHQFLSQLPANLRQAVLGNVGTLIAFRVGADDADTLKMDFGFHQPIRSHDLTIDDSPRLPFCDLGIHSPQALMETPNFRAWIKAGTSPPEIMATLPDEPATGSLARFVRGPALGMHDRGRKLRGYGILSLMAAKRETMPKVSIHGNQLTLPDILREALTTAEADAIDAEEVVEGILLKRSASARRKTGLAHLRSAQSGVSYAGPLPRRSADEEERWIADTLYAEKLEERAKRSK